MDDEHGSTGDASEKQQKDDEKKEEKRAEEVEDRSSPPGSIVYLAVRKEGEDELERPTSALAWSGLAAGLSMGFSFVAQSLIEAHLPKAEWTPLVSSLGYSIGFLIVVLGRQQLFTENTLTVILPLLTRRPGATVANVARLWATVLIANTVGAILFAFVVAKTELFEPKTYLALTEVGTRALEGTFLTTLLRGIFAGWLIALMVWLLPFAETARVWVIIIITWLVGLGHFAHIIAGSVEVAFAGFTHHASIAEIFTGFYIPALLGNVIGGVSLVAAINHAQVVAGKGGEDV